MYSWIWGKLPFGLPGKIVGSAVLLGAVGALLWFVVFPAVSPLLPFNQSTVGGGDEEQQQQHGGSDDGDDNEDGVPSHDPSDYELEDSPEPSQSN